MFDNLYDFTDELLKNEQKIPYMNHGYFPIFAEIENNDDIFFKSSASLYFLIVQKIKYGFYGFNKILEIGCGRGGGANLIKQNFPGCDLQACDNNLKNINFCNTSFKNINFFLGDAENLKLHDKFDVVINVESSHCYNNLSNFFTNVNNLLNNKGKFYYLDIFTQEMFDLSLNHLKNLFLIEEVVNITENVIESLIYTKGLFSTFENIEIKSFINETCDKKIFEYKSKQIQFYFFVLKKI